MEYALNEKKSRRRENEENLRSILGEAMNQSHTEQDLFQTGLGCTLESPFADMLAVKKQWRKLGGVEGYHLVQSFAPGEATPELAHQVLDTGLVDMLMFSINPGYDYHHGDYAIGGAEERAALSAAYVLGLMEAEAAEIPDGSQRPPLIFRQKPRELFRLQLCSAIKGQADLLAVNQHLCHICPVGLAL